MTIRVVLADDEPIIIKGLRKLIDWEGLGMEIVGQAYDGLALMEAIEMHKPDLVISDISMPHLTGIDIIKEINSRSLPVKVIFISAYQEFSYAKDAVVYGAVDYLVKPLIKSELDNVLSKTAALIGQKDEEERRKDKLQLIEQRSRNDEIQEWLVRLTDRSLSNRSEAYQVVQERFPGPFHSIGIVEIDRVLDEPERWPVQETKLVHFALENVLTELLSEYGRGQVFYKNNRYVLLMDHVQQEEPIRLANDIKEKIESYLKLKISLGMGLPVADIGLLADSYNQAEQALQMKYFIGLNLVIMYEQVEQKQGFEDEMYTLQSKVIRDLSSNAWGDALISLEELLETIESATVGNVELAVSTCFSSTLFMIQEIKNSGVPLSESGFDIHDLQKRLAEFETYYAMKKGIVEIMEELHHRIDDKASNKEKMLILKIKQYIDEHYAEEITLESVAAIAFMNPYYFSSFFKKHMKQNFKQYVTEARMQQAMRLLTQTCMMIYEIAEKVGYNNARHFSDMFKKRFGKLPQEVRLSLKE
ncbi:response regulator [Cohnella sp.]|uniref:response regulator n=1 Tax=Cohnella sp. TaxID=1883426 RepID=UPI0035661476